METWLATHLNPGLGISHEDMRRRVEGVSWLDLGLENEDGKVLGAGIPELEMGSN
jgi:hypothetical protein